MAYSDDEFDDEFPDINDLLSRPIDNTANKTSEKHLPPSLFDPETPPRTSRKPKSVLAASGRKGQASAIRKVPKSTGKAGDLAEDTPLAAANPRKPLREAKDDAFSVPKESTQCRKTPAKKLGKGDGLGEESQREQVGDSGIVRKSAGHTAPTISRREISVEQPITLYRGASSSSGEEPPKTVRKWKRLQQRQVIDLPSSSESEDDRPQIKSIPKLNTAPESECEGTLSHESRSSINDLPGAILSYSPPKSSKPKKIIPPPAPPLKRPSAPSNTRKTATSSKKAPHTPSTPLVRSSDEFWEQQPPQDDDDDEYTEPEEFPIATTGKKESTTSSSKPDKEKRNAKKAFNARKVKLAEEFVKEVDEKITQGEIARLTSSTGGVKVVWNRNLRTTAGMAKHKKEKLPTDGRVELGNVDACARVRHHAIIELSEKVVDNEEKLYNVICHEWCHLANFIISNISKPPHGTEFKRWGAKCTRTFSHLNVQVTTVHSYDIDCKYRWTCQSCGYIYKRHSQSIDTTRSRCGACSGGVLVQTHPPPKEKRELSGYQLFLKENFSRIKGENPGTPHRELMKLVGVAYREVKGPGGPVAAKEGGTGEDLSKILGGLTL